MFPLRVRTGFFAVMLLALLVPVVACRKEDRQNFEAKCDAGLRLRVEELAGSHPDSLLDVLGRANVAIDDALKAQLEKAGAQLTQVTEELFAARIPVRRVVGVANLDFITSLSLSQTRAPLGP
jgi:hypothetical protein